MQNEKLHKMVISFWRKNTSFLISYVGFTTIGTITIAPRCRDSWFRIVSLWSCKPTARIHNIGFWRIHFVKAWQNILTFCFSKHLWTMNYTWTNNAIWWHDKTHSKIMNSLIHCFVTYDLSIGQCVTLKL